MTSQEMITYINNRLKSASPNGHLSKIGEKFIEERMNKSEKDGGFSDYWKSISLEQALHKEV